jgi:hypothetical protein
MKHSRNLVHAIIAAGVLATLLGAPLTGRADRFSGGAASGYGMREAAFTLGVGTATVSLAQSQILTRDPQGAAVAMPAITVADHATAPVIKAAGGIRISLPASSRLAWDSTATTPTLGGSASGKVSSTVAYADADRTLVVTVTDDFAAGDTLKLNGLAVTNRIDAARPEGLELNLRGGTGQPDAYSRETLAVTVPRPGGPGQGYAMDTMSQDMLIVARGTLMMIR